MGARHSASSYVGLRNETAGHSSAAEQREADSQCPAAPQLSAMSIVIGLTLLAVLVVTGTRPGMVHTRPQQGLEPSQQVLVIPPTTRPPTFRDRGNPSPTTKGITAALLTWPFMTMEHTTVTRTTTETVTSTAAVPGPHPTLLCIALMLPFGGEVALIRMQLKHGVGIFGCNGWDVYSNTSVELGSEPPTHTKIIPGSLQCDFGHQYVIPNALNSEIFYRFWTRVIQDGHYLLHDWTLKLDPDTVILPGRFRQEVENSNPEDRVYLNNCGKGLHGPLETLSRAGMKRFAEGLQDCHDFLEHEWMTYGEDVWMRRCLKHLEVAPLDKFGLLYERACAPYKWPLPCDTPAAAFHPLKTPKGYLECLHNAGG